MRRDSVSIERMIIQAVLGSSCVPSAPRSLLIGSTTLRGADHAAGDQIGMPADVLGQGIQDDVRAVRERALKDRAQKGVVDQSRADARRPAPCRFSRTTLAHEREIDQAVGRIGGSLAS